MSSTIMKAPRVSRAVAGQPCDSCLKPFVLRQRSVMMCDSTRLCVECFAQEERERTGAAP